MGANNSNLRQAFEDEYNRVKKDRNYLVPSAHISPSPFVRKHSYTETRSHVRGCERLCACLYVPTASVVTANEMSDGRFLTLVDVSREKLAQICGGETLILVGDWVGNCSQVLDNLLNFNMPNMIHLQLTHIGVLFVMDR
jgi:hypothetical protein